MMSCQKRPPSQRPGPSAGSLVLALVVVVSGSVAAGVRTAAAATHGSPRELVAEASGVRVELEPSAWSGRSALAEEGMTPLRTTIENGSGLRILLRYEHFYLLSPSGLRYLALSPEAVEARPPRGAPPCSRTSDGAIPEGVLEVGEAITGFLFFEDVPPSTARVTFHADLVEASTGKPFDEVDIYFTTRDGPLPAPPTVRLLEPFDSRRVVPAAVALGPEYPVHASPVDLRWEIPPGTAPAVFRLAVDRFRDPHHPEGEGTDARILEKRLATSSYHTPLPQSPPGTYYELRIEASNLSGQPLAECWTKHPGGSVRGYRFRVR